jgi:hypothetical protein
MQRRRTVREEANALTCYAFRNGPLEDLHAGKQSPLLEDPTLSRITDEEMKRLMINASATLAKALALKESDPAKYWQLIDRLCDTYTRNWVKDDPAQG